LHNINRCRQNESLVDVWINLNAGVLGDENSMENIAINGFVIPENGLRVSTGHIELEPSTLQDNTLHSINVSRSGKKQKVYKLLHCLAAVGRCFCVEALEGEVLIPEDYDSIYITPGDDDAHYAHQYVLFDAKRVSCFKKSEFNMLDFC
jgi:hypothetical protein